MIMIITYGRGATLRRLGAMLNLCTAVVWLRCREHFRYNS